MFETRIFFLSSCESSNFNCTINLVMPEAEEQMREFFRHKTFAWLDKELNHALSKKQRTDTREYFAKKALTRSP